MDTAPICTSSIDLDQRFRRALARAPQGDSAALQQAFDAYIKDIGDQLRAFARQQGGAYYNALSHALTKSSFQPYVRHDFTRSMPMELLWNIFSNLPPEDLRSMADVNARSFEAALSLVGPKALLATRRELATSAPQHLRFDDDLHSQRHWGGYPNPNPVHPGCYLMSHEEGVELSRIEGDKLATIQRWPVPRHPTYGHKIPNAWHPSGESYAFIAHQGESRPVLFTGSRDGGEPTSTPLPFSGINRIDYLPHQPEFMALSMPARTVIVRASAPDQVVSDVPGWEPISSSTRAFCPVRPWVLRRKEDRRVNRVLVVDYGRAEPRVLHELDLLWSHSGDAAWHATRPMFAVVDDQSNFCIVNLEGDAPVITRTSIWNLIKFRNSSSHGHFYLSWDPSGKDIVAASCSSELLLTRIHDNEAVRVAVGAISNVNGRGFNWTRDGHLEVFFSDGDVTRYKPADCEIT